MTRTKSTGVSSISPSSARTDTAGRHSFGDYRGFRFMTCFAAAAASLLYAGLFAKSPEARWCIIAMVAYKIFDGFADVYDSEFQRQGRLYLTGKSNAFRTLFSVAVFFAVMPVAMATWLGALSVVPSRSVLVPNIIQR